MVLGVIGGVIGNMIGAKLGGAVFGQAFGLAFGRGLEAMGNPLAREAQKLFDDALGFNRDNKIVDNVLSETQKKSEVSKHNAPPNV